MFCRHTVGSKLLTGSRNTRCLIKIKGYLIQFNGLAIHAYISILTWHGSATFHSHFGMQNCVTYGADLMLVLGRTACFFQFVLKSVKFKNMHACKNIYACRHAHTLSPCSDHLHLRSLSYQDHEPRERLPSEQQQLSVP